MSAAVETLSKEQEVAIQSFLPFVVELFGRGELRLKRAALMPVGQPSALTLEVVQAAAEVMRRGTLASLCRLGGWRALDLGQPGRDDPLRAVRVIDPRLWPGLALSRETMDLALVVYNAVCVAGGQALPTKQRKLYPATLALSFERGGDLLASHLIWLKVRQAPFRVEDVTWQLLITNPLTQVARLGLLDEPEALFAMLYQGPIAALMPWLSDHLARCWARELSTRWDSLTRFHKLNSALALWGAQLIKQACAHERRDWLIPLVRFWHHHLASSGVELDWISQFNSVARDLRFADREDYQRTWASALDVAVTIQHHYQEARAIHPIDRESPDRVFMEAYEAVSFQDTAARARVLADQLNAIIR